MLVLLMYNLSRSYAITVIYEKMQGINTSNSWYFSPFDEYIGTHTVIFALARSINSNITGQTQ